MPQKVAVLGGGMGALSAAYELMESDKTGRYEIHVYQMGWRLGGKCATGRNLEPGKRFRNEEHGLHVLGGWYHNTFAMLRTAYAAWPATNATGVRPLDEAFLALPGATLYQQSSPLLGGVHGWREIKLDIPSLPGVPGVNPPELTPSRLIQVMLAWARELASKLNPFAKSQLGSPRHESLADQVADKIESLEQAYLDLKPSHRDEELKGRFLTPATDLIADLEAIAGLLPKPQGHQTVAKHPTSFQLFPSGILSTLYDAWNVMTEAIVIARGFIADRVPWRGFDPLNDEEGMAWLRRHGAPERVIESAFVQVGYHYAFSFTDGDPSKPNSAAGATLRAFARMLTIYNGAFFHHFNGSTADVMVTPLYDVMKARGVKFHFFNQVMSLEPSADGDSIDRIVMRHQAKVKAGPTDYDPFVTEHGVRGWPDRPLMDQLELAPFEPHFPANFEDPADVDPAERFVTLKKGEDFDLIILGIPGAALTDIAAPLAAKSARWATMLASFETCPTLAYQAWTEDTIADLGWTSGPPIATGYILPLSTWSDMSFLLEQETDEGAPYKALSYFCGPVRKRDIPHYQEVAKTWIERHADGFLPDFSPAKVGDSYLRVNATPSELYIFAATGKVKDRLRADDTGMDNLFLTGDWVSNGSDLGWVEGAVMSGRQCARAISGVPMRVYGESDYG